MSLTVSPAPPSRWTRLVGEETLNQITHGAGWVLSLVGATLLIGRAWQQPGTRECIGCTIYALTLVALYGASTLSHSFLDPRRRHFFRMLDQVCIFLLIAGTFTPFGLTYLREGWTSALTAAIWAGALVGIFFKVFFSRLTNVATAAYVVLGWLPILAWGPITTLMPEGATTLMLAGGALYTVGTVFLMTDTHVPYFHVVWHLLVMAASACHFMAVWRYVLA